MKRTALAVVMLAAAWRLFAQQGGREQFDLYGGILYRGTGTSTLTITSEDRGLAVSGTASGATPGGGGGYVIESRGNLELNGCKTLIIKVSGISETDKFNLRKLLKLEINKKALRTETPAMRNRNDPDYINAENEDAVFDISKIKNIKSVNLVFFDCAMNNVRIEMFYE